MHPLSSKLLLAIGELNFDELHLQRGLLGPRWRGLHGMCRRKVEKRGRVGQLRRLPGKLELACSEHSFDAMPVQCRLLWT